LETMSKNTKTENERTQPVDVEVPAKPKRRRFTAEYKLRILNEVDAAPHGEQGTILRREGLYSSQVAEWRAARRAGTLGALARKRGRKKDPAAAAYRRIAELEKKLAATEAELEKAHLILEVQGKVAGLLGFSLSDGKTS